MQRLIKSLDTLIYGFVAPFGVLYVFPRFFLGLEQNLDIELPRILALKYTGVLLMNLGGLLAITCALFMHTRKSGTISPFVRPTELVRRGPYAWVRHPMMWAGNFVLIGLMLIYSSPLLALWLLIWSRFAAIYIDRYEEPYLVRIFGDEYREYCRTTPRWWPKPI
ncbi:methyltransferase family protein [Stutzerimonas stutzeri]|uniref:methyltransferase family protein n=1 Tax=Stutzerimonas stutzeri TaxID=316 RepID=UPI0015E45D98|nr:isoprenylcysteine carboxylmethyltransferase family protein [Stutzerimonas stutzeri]MBA1262813.1 isoprenylcysteine carboxylmethyltransferase family protein [Stutzerimonas stutzeri]